MTQIDDRPAQPQPPVEEHAPQKVTTPERSRRKRLSPGVIVGLGGAAVGIVGAALWGINSATSTSTPNGAPTPDDRGTNAPSPTASEQAPGQGLEKLTVKGMEIKAGLSDQDFAKTLYDKDHFGAWAMVGTTDQTDKDFIAYKLQPNGGKGQPPTSGFTGPLAQENGQIAGEALYANPAAMSSRITYHDQVNEAVMENFFITYNSDNPADIQPYTYSYSVGDGDVVAKRPTTPSGRELEITVTEHDNAALNRIGSVPAYKSPYQVEGHKFVVDISTKVINGVEKITDEEVVSESK
jgi:hypothetical protein